ncbi:hypothetical protein [Halorarius halobius]|uniref:hypothetical protein n=1 Tax=Halorarius halobius TaxID=2962671 RepID=UPI0020CC38EB|nr:hypothetical protein [Halorarius halobius]
MARFSLRALVAIVVIVTGVTTTAVVAPAAAQTDTEDRILEGVFGDDGETSVSDYARAGWALASGAADRARHWTSKRVPSFLAESVPALAPEETSAVEEASAVTTYYNSHNETLEAYVNERGNFTGNHTVKVTWKLDGEEETRYVLANESGGDVSTRMVESTNRTADETVTVCGFAAESSYEELQHFVEEYAEPNEDLDASYLARLKGRYGDDVDTSLYPSSGECSGGDSSS